MRLFPPLFAITLLLALPAHGDAGRQADPRLVGCWYGHGEQTVRGVDVHWLVRNYRDGTFKSRFRAIRPDASVFEQVERGEWKFDGGVLVVTTRSSRARGEAEHAVLFRDEYDVPDPAARPLVYVLRGKAMRFEARPVACSFDLEAAVPDHPTH